MRAWCVFLVVACVWHFNGLLKTPTACQTKYCSINQNPCLMAMLLSTPFIVASWWWLLVGGRIRFSIIYLHLIEFLAPRYSVNRRAGHRSFLILFGLLIRNNGKMCECFFEFFFRFLEFLFEFHTFAVCCNRAMQTVGWFFFVFFFASSFIFQIFNFMQ